jgi:hypothetical protein
MLNNKVVKFALIPMVALMAACGQSKEPKVDDALRNDLSLAAQQRPYAPQQYVSPQELQPGMPGYQQPQYAGYANGPNYAPQPARTAPAQRTVVHHVYQSSSSGASAPARSRIVKKNTNRDAAIGAVAGAAIGAATSRDKLKGGIIGAVAGGVLGGVIGNNVDVKKRP